MKQVYYVLAIVGVLSFSSCEKLLMEKELSDTPMNNFEVLSKVIKEKYSYLVLKNINWDSIVSVNRIRISDGMNEIEEFEVYEEMLYALEDGHVNLVSGFNVSRNWEWYLGSPPNFNWDMIERNYLGNDYFITGGLKHTTLDNRKYGYVYYGSFSSSVTNIEFVKSHFRNKGVKGIIIDVRNNGGGYVSNAKILASAFADKERVGYMEYTKSGVNPNAFSDPISYNVEPSGETWNKPIVLITNKQCFSSTSFFATMMKEFPNVTVIGNNTGGGAGLPVDYTLPNGWYLRYSTTRATDARGVDFELGVEVDEKVDMSDVDIQNGEDTIIERAKAIIDGV